MSFISCKEATKNAPDRESKREIEGNDYDYLRLKTAPFKPISDQRFNYIDLFSGCGGTALGVDEACRSLGMRSHVPFAIDNNPSAGAVFRDNFPKANFVLDDILNFLSPELDVPISAAERKLAAAVGAVDLVIGGPPCQGHSDLNNFSRRQDPKNALYSSMARAARVFRPKHVVIENVQGIPHDRNQVFQATVSELNRLGYDVEAGLVDLALIGVPQRRRRHIVIASLGVAPPRLPEIIAKNEIVEQRGVRWAIEDLRVALGEKLIDTPSTPSQDNKRRIDYLFDNNLYDLPNTHRPPCHRDKKQTYKSIYGRLRWDVTSQTITSGFYSMCMGRYVHPSERRTLTAHEAARIQFFPDFFSFEAAGNRTSIAKLIGNAVPMKLAYVIVLSLLGQKIGKTV